MLHFCYAVGRKLVKEMFGLDEGDLWHQCHLDLALHNGLVITPTGLAIFVCGEASSVRACLRHLHLSIGIGNGIGEDATCFLEVLLACNISQSD